MWPNEEMSCFLLVATVDGGPVGVMLLGDVGRIGIGSEFATPCGHGRQI